MRMTQRNFAANAPPGAGSNTQRAIELADAEKNEMLMSFIHWDRKTGRLVLA
jgi:hypothetical protein